jgi:hypothetical protein
MKAGKESIQWIDLAKVPAGALACPDRKRLDGEFENTTLNSSPLQMNYRVYTNIELTLWK